MLFFALMHEAWISIGASRLRTALAMLGIVIGVGSVVLMIAIGSGSRRSVEDAINALGSNQLIVMPGSDSHSFGKMGMPSAFDMADVSAIAQVSSVVAVAPATYPRSLQIAIGHTNAAAQVTGTSAVYFTIANWTFAAGSAFTGDDLQQSKPVAVIGSEIADQLFADMPPESVVGRTLHVNGTAFRIAGVLKSKGAGFNGRSQDDQMFIPITTAKTRLMGQEFFTGMAQMIYVQAASREAMDDATDGISDALRHRNKAHHTSGDNFTIHNLSQVTQAASDTAQTFTMLLGAIASISLIVGSIGIMNIMLVTVAERTREIGIRKAIGATRQQILLQFMMEAVMISVVGSVIGLLIGFGCGIAAQECYATAVEYSIWSVVMALGAAAGIGIISGIYPAFKAAHLQPIEALRSVGA